MRGLKGHVYFFKNHWKLVPILYFAKYVGAIWLIKSPNSVSQYSGWAFLALALLQDINHWACYQYAEWGGWKKLYGDNPPWDPAQK